MFKLNNSKQITINKQHRLGSHEEQHFAFFISTPNLMLGVSINGGFPNDRS